MCKTLKLLYDKPVRMLAVPVTVKKTYGSITTPFGSFTSPQTIVLQFPELLTCGSLCILDYIASTGEGCPLYVVFCRKQSVQTERNSWVAHYTKDYDVMAVRTQQTQAIRPLRPELLDGEVADDGEIGDIHGCESDEGDAPFSDDETSVEEVVKDIDGIAQDGARLMELVRSRIVL